MTPGQFAVIDPARRTPARILEIDRTRRGTAHRNMMKRYSAKAALERERVPISFANERGKGREIRMRFFLAIALFRFSLSPRTLKSRLNQMTAPS